MANSYEARFSQRVRIHIHGMGRKTYKMSQRFERGIPDIYIPNGIWIESKIVYYGGPRSRYQHHPIRHLTNAQRWVMDNLTQDGDLCLVCILWMVDAGTSRFMLIPWKTFRHVLRWNIEDIMHFSSRFDAQNIPIPKFWNGRDVVMDTFNDRFKSWINKNNDHFYDETTTSDHWFYENGKLIGGKSNPINLQKFAKVAIGDNQDLASWLSSETRDNNQEIEYGNDDESDP